MPLEVGSRLGHYDVTAKIGEGGMREVYRARDTKLDREVAQGFGHSWLLPPLRCAHGITPEIVLDDAR